MVGEVMMNNKLVGEGVVVTRFRGYLGWGLVSTKGVSCHWWNGFLVESFTKVLCGHAKVGKLVATSAFTSLGTASPLHINQQSMYFPWRGSHLAIMEDGSNTLLVISATESCSW